MLAAYGGYGIGAALLGPGPYDQHLAAALEAVDLAQKRGQDAARGLVQSCLAGGG